jgi:hypothetical protein
MFRKIFLVGTSDLGDEHDNSCEERQDDNRCADLRNRSKAARGAEDMVDSKCLRLCKCRAERHPDRRRLAVPDPSVILRRNMTYEQLTRQIG